MASTSAGSVTDISAGDDPGPFKWSDTFIGTPVVLCGLSRTELNGVQGKIEAYDAEKQRLGVRVAGHAKPLAIKIENLAPAEPAGPAAGHKVGVGYDTCPVCGDQIRQSCNNHTILACGHVLHANCWDQINTVQYLDELSLDPKALKLGTHSPALHCPVCNKYHGPSSATLFALPPTSTSTADGHGHETREVVPTWFHRTAKDTMHQLCGFAFQHEKVQRTGAEGTTAEETVFITQCRNRLQKARGGVQAFDSLNAAMQGAVAVCPDLEKEPAARLPEQARLRLRDAVAECSRLSLCETKKGKVVSRAAADVWMDCVRRWLRSAGYTEDEVEGIA